MVLNRFLGFSNCTHFYFSLQHLEFRADDDGSTQVSANAEAGWTAFLDVAIGPIPATSIDYFLRAGFLGNLPG